MADPMQYTGYTYDSSLYKQPTESMIDYMQRLAAQRATGVLGGGGMLDTPTPVTETDPVLGTVTQTCPAGFVLQNGACVRASDSSGSGDQTPAEPARRAADNKYGYVDPTSLGGLLAMAVPFGGIAMGLNNAEAVKAAQQAAGLTPTGFFDRLFTNPIDESIGTKTINDRDYKVAIGGSVVDKPSIIATMFDSLLGNESATGSTSLTPAEAMRRSNMANYGKNWTATPYAAPSVNDPRAVASSSVNGMLQQAIEQELAYQRAQDMNAAMSNANSGASDWGSSGYYTDSSGNSYTGGSDYGGWTGVTADGSGNDWDSF